MEEKTRKDLPDDNVTADSPSPGESGEIEGIENSVGNVAEAPLVDDAAGEPESDVAADVADGGDALAIADLTEIDGASAQKKPKSRKVSDVKERAVAAKDGEGAKATDDGAKDSGGGRADAPAQKPKWKAIVGTALALIPALACLVIFAVSAHMNGLAISGMPILTRNLIFISLALIAISVALAVSRPRLPKALGWIVWTLAPAGVMLLAEWIIRDPFDGKMTWKVILLNMAIYYITAAFFLFLTRNTFVSTVAASVFPLLLAIANHYVRSFRGTVLFPWDLQSVGIAMTVVDNYEFDFPVVIAFVLTCFIVIWQLAYFSRVKILRSVKKMIVSFVCALLFLAMGIGYGAYMRTDDVVSRFRLYPYLFTPNSVYTRDGMMVSVLFSLKFMGVEKPDGYSEEAVASLAAEYAAKDDSAEAKEKPNVIVIMNEAWSDISVDAPFETNAEVFPVTSKLTDNVIRGNMYMSVNGGNTANSEFEFLTGSSMAFMPPGSVPYQLFIKHDTPTLVSSFEEQGYQSAAMHPYNAPGWDRNKVYQYFGFDDMYFINDFPKNAEKIRSYISDRAMFTKIEEVYEARDESKPFFLFGVTMQNHSGYTGHFDNFEQSVNVKGLESNAQLSQYLSLIRETDFAFGELLDYFSNVDEPTVILMFGDHQPNDFVTAALYPNAGLAYPPETFEAEQDKFIVPFIMWANYDVEEKTGVMTSPNYLSILLCETAGLKLTPYQKYLREMREKYPVVTANFCIDSDGKFHANDEMKTLPGFNEYSVIQYNQIIDYNNRYEKMFQTSK